MPLQLHCTCLTSPAQMFFIISQVCFFKQLSFKTLLNLKGHELNLGNLSFAKFLFSAIMQLSLRS